MPRYVSTIALGSVSLFSLYFGFHDNAGGLIAYGIYYMVAAGAAAVIETAP